MASEKRPSSLYLDLKQLKEKFEEVDSEGKGYIDRDGLQQLTEGLDPDELMLNLDRDKDGKVTLEDLQMLFTLERDSVKTNLQQLDASCSNSESTSPYFSAIDFQQQQSPTRTGTYISPDKPPVPKGRSRTYRQGSSQSLAQVPNSPDLADHARSLRGTVLHSPVIDTKRLSLASDPGDLCLEDTGSVGIYPSPLPSPKYYPRTHAFELMVKELESLCPSGSVSQENILQFCKKFGNDSQDEQHLLAIWDHLNKLAPNKVTIDSIMHFLHESETRGLDAIITSTPAPLSQSLPVPGWREDPQNPPVFSGFFGTPIAQSQESPTTHYTQVSEDVDGAQCKPDESAESSSDDSLPLFSKISHPLRPKSASRVGDRLSRGGYSESSIVPITDFKKLQETILHLSQERDSLRLSLSRAEEERKRVIHEGDDDVQKLQNQKDSEISKMQEEYSTKVKDMERSFIYEQESLQEKAAKKIASLEEQIKTIKNEAEVLKDDLRFYQQDNRKLVDELHTVQSLAKERKERIKMLECALGFQTDAVSEVDIEKQAAHISELEGHIHELEAHNELLKEQNLELNDRADEMKAEYEELKLKVIGEKRKRQRRKSGSSTPGKPSSAKKRRDKDDSKRAQRMLPQSLATPVTMRKKSTGGEAEGLDMTEEGLEIFPGLELENPDVMEENADSPFEAVGSETEDLQAQSSASLMDELRTENHKQVIGEKMHALESQRSILEASCQDLRTQLEGMEETKVALRKEIEEDLRKKMFQRAKLDKHLKQLSMLREDMASARKQFTDKMMFNEDYISQYMEGLETDINQMIVEDVETGVSQTTMVKQLHGQVDQLQSQVDQLQSEVDQLQSQLKESKVLSNRQRECIQLLEDGANMHSIELHKVQQQLQDSRHMHEEEVVNFKQALLKHESLVNNIKTQAESQQKEYEAMVAQLTADLEHERNKRHSVVAKQAELLQLQPTESELDFSAQQQLNILQQEQEKLKFAMESLETDNGLLRTQLASLQDNCCEVQQKLDKSESVRRALETKLESHERELKTKKTEAALAIHDLTQKEQEMDNLDDKLEKMKKTQEDHLAIIASLHSSNDTLAAVADLKQKQLQSTLMELELQQSEFEKLATQSQQLLANQTRSEKEIEEYMSNLERFERENSQLRVELEQYQSFSSNSPMHVTTGNTTSPLPSPSSTYSTQSAIMTQMKAQLTSLQQILAGRGGEETTDSDLSIVQELLAINASLGERLRLQQEQHNQEIARRHMQLSPMTAQLVAKLGADASLSPASLTVIVQQIASHVTEPLQNVPDLIAALSKRVSLLSSTISRVHQTIAMRDSQQMDALDGLLSDMESTRAERNSYRQEVNLLTSGMEMTGEDSYQLREEETDVREKVTPEELSLTKEVGQLKSELEQRMKEVEHEQRKSKTNQDIIHRQNEQLKILNYQLGKATSLKERYDNEQQQRDREILHKSMEIQQLREEIERCRISSVSEPSLLSTISSKQKEHLQALEGPRDKVVEVTEEFVDAAPPLPTMMPDASPGLEQMREELRRSKEIHTAELLMQQEALQVAEELITNMRGQLHDLHQDLVNPSDSSAADLLDSSEIIAQIRREIGHLKFELSQHEEQQKHFEKQLSLKASEYDSLYAEHDEEVRALHQQKEHVILQLDDMEERFQHLLSAHEKQLMECQELTGSNANLFSLLSDQQEECKRVQTVVNELETQKHVLVDLVRKLSLQVIQGLSSFA